MNRKLLAAGLVTSFVMGTSGVSLAATPAPETVHEVSSAVESASLLPGGYVALTPEQLALIQGDFDAWMWISGAAETLGGGAVLSAGLAEVAAGPPAWIIVGPTIATGAANIAHGLHTVWMSFQV